MSGEEWCQRVSAKVQEGEGRVGGARRERGNGRSEFGTPRPSYRHACSRIPLASVLIRTGDQRLISTSLSLPLPFLLLLLLPLLPLPLLSLSVLLMGGVCGWALHYVSVGIGEVWLCGRAGEVGGLRGRYSAVLLPPPLPHSKLGATV